VGKPGGKRSLGGPRNRLENTIKMDIRETGWGGVEWINGTQDRDQWNAIANTIINLRVSLNFGKFLSNYVTGGFSRSLRETVQSFRIIGQP
jgi:hypothetical protein